MGKLLKGLCSYAFLSRPFEIDDPIIKTAFTLIKVEIDKELSEKEHRKLSTQISTELKNKSSQVILLTNYSPIEEIIIESKPKRGSPKKRTKKIEPTDVAKEVKNQAG